MYNFKYWLVALSLIMWQSLTPTFAMDDDSDTTEMMDIDSGDEDDLAGLAEELEDEDLDENNFKEDESIEVAKLAVKEFAKSSLALCRDNAKHVETHASKHRKGLLGRLSAYKNKVLKNFKNAVKNIQTRFSKLVRGVDEQNDPEELMQAMDNIQKYSEACKKLTMKTIANLAVEELNRRKSRRRITLGTHRNTDVEGDLAAEEAMKTKADKKAQRKSKREARKSRKLEQRAAKRSKKSQKKAEKKSNKKQNFRFWPWSKKKEAASAIDTDDDFEELETESKENSHRRRSKGMAYEAMLAKKKQERKRAATL